MSAKLECSPVVSARFPSHRTGATCHSTNAAAAHRSTQWMSGTGPFGRVTCTVLDEGPHGRIAQRVAPVDQGLLLGFIESIQPCPDVLQSVRLGRVAWDLVGGGVFVVLRVDAPIRDLLTAQLPEFDQVAGAQATRS